MGRAWDAYYLELPNKDRIIYWQECGKLYCEIMATIDHVYGVLNSQDEAVISCYRCNYYRGGIMTLPNDCRAFFRAYPGMTLCEAFDMARDLAKAFNGKCYFIHNERLQWHNGEQSTLQTWELQQIIKGG